MYHFKLKLIVLLHRFRYYIHTQMVQCILCTGTMYNEYFIILYHFPVYVCTLENGKRNYGKGGLYIYKITPDIKE